MYILVADGGYPSAKYKLNGIFAFDQAKALTSSGHRIVFAGLDMRSVRRWRKWGFESFMFEGVQIESINIPCGALPCGLADKIRILAFRLLYKKISKKYGHPDIIHSHFINISYAAAHLAVKESIPLVVTEHYSGMNQDVISPLLMKYGRYVYARANRILAVSTYLKNNLIDKFDVEVDVVPNIVDLSSFKRNEQRENSENYQKDSKECDGNRENLTEGKTFSIVSVGALNSNKRMDLLIESFYAAFNGAPGFKLYIYGDGKERDRLQDLIDRLKLEHNVFLMGVGHRTEIANKMRESDCFALFSKLETFGVSFIEALSLGLPVISTKSGGPEDFISNENGIIVNDESIASLAGAIVQMHNDIEKYDKTKVSRSVEERFGPQVISSRLLEIYLNVLEEKMQRKPETND